MLQTVGSLELSKGALGLLPEVSVRARPAALETPLFQHVLHRPHSLFQVAVFAAVSDHQNRERDKLGLPLFRRHDRRRCHTVSFAGVVRQAITPNVAPVAFDVAETHHVGAVALDHGDGVVVCAPDQTDMIGSAGAVPSAAVLPVIEDHIATLAAFLEKYQLQANPDKERIYAPGQAWDFLGFKCLGRSIDIADATRRKMQDKIRRKAHALLRWRLKENVPPEAALRAMIRHFNAKFFEGDDPGTLTWSRWFFPLLTQADGLRQIDRYLQDQLRFLATGRHVKKNFSIRYGTLKSLGYRSLVHEFYAFREDS